MAALCRVMQLSSQVSCGCAGRVQFWVLVLFNALWTSKPLTSDGRARPLSKLSFLFFRQRAFSSPLCKIPFYFYATPGCFFQQHKNDVYTLSHVCAQAQRVDTLTILSCSAKRQSRFATIPQLEVRYIEVTSRSHRGHIEVTSRSCK